MSVEKWYGGVVICWVLCLLFLQAFHLLVLGIAFCVLEIVCLVLMILSFYHDNYMSDLK